MEINNEIEQIEEDTNSGETLPEEEFQGEENMEPSTTEPGETEDDVVETFESDNSVSSSVSDYDARFDEIILLLEEQNEQIYSLQESREQTLWNKPIEEYSPTEGLLLIMMFIMLFVLIYELVGGIIICKK